MSRMIEIITLRTTAGTEPCTDRVTCPGIHALPDRPGRKYVIVKEVADTDELAAFAPLMAAGGILGYGPDELFEGLV